MTPIRTWTEAQKARRARKLARRRAAGHEPPPPIDPEKLELERKRLARLRARRPAATRARKRDYSPETVAAWLRFLGFVQGGAPRHKHRIRKIAKATRQAARR